MFEDARQKQVALLTDYYEPDTSYSPVIVAELQLKMLLGGGYQPIAIVDQNFKPERVWEQVELRWLPSPKERKNEVELYPQLGDDVKAIRAALDTALAGVDVIITHDMIYQAAILPLNIAARLWAREHPDVTWLHWVHSATPSPVWTSPHKELAICQKHMPNSKICFPNSWDVPRVAANFRCNASDVAVVPHPTDLVEFFGFQDITKKLVREKDLLSADAIFVYPVRLDRGKQVEMVLRTASALKKMGRSVRVICVAFHSTGDDKITYRQDLERMLPELDLNEVEVTFTNTFDKSLWMRSSREVVRDLMLISNVFVGPSVSETYSLIAQEAGLCGAFLVLNRDLPIYRTVYGQHAAYFQFSSAVNALTGEDGRTDTEYGDRDGYFHKVAGQIAYELEYNPAIAQRTRIRKERNPGYVFRRYLEPLLYWREGRG